MATELPIPTSCFRVYFAVGFDALNSQWDFYKLAFFVNHAATIPHPKDYFKIYLTKFYNCRKSLRMAKTKKLRQVRISDENSKRLEQIRERLPIKPGIEALTNSALSLGLGMIVKTNKLETV